MPNRDIKLDYGRRERLGFDEAILCDSKTIAQIRTILDDASMHAHRLLLTRLQNVQFNALPPEYRAHMNYEEISGTAYFGAVAEPQGAARVALVSAGTSDIGVSREAARTLHYCGVGCEEIYDVGVAGLWRLLDRIDEIRTFPVVIVVAGMDAALPSVLGGLVASPVIAVPTSTGYGVATAGYTALHAALTSCAPGVMVVNIDNGYGAACAALRVLNTVAVSWQLAG